MNLHVSAPPITIPAHLPPEVFRKSIDRVSTLRARAIRVGLFGTLLCRPEPKQKEKPEIIETRSKALQTEVDIIHSVCEMLNKGTELPDMPKEMSTWIHLIAQCHPVQLRIISEISVRSQAVARAAHRNSADFDEVVNAHMTAGQNGFFDAVTFLGEALWDATYEHNAAELALAKQAARSLADRLKRLEHIGKHVRIASLNASVEAARAGDVGRGLMVVANEFKNLAEEIQTLATQARRDVQGISE